MSVFHTGQAWFLMMSLVLTFANWRLLSTALSPTIGALGQLPTSAPWRCLQARGGPAQAPCSQHSRSWPPQLMTALLPTLPTSEQLAFGGGVVHSDEPVRKALPLQRKAERPASCSQRTVRQARSCPEVLVCILAQAAWKASKKARSEAPNSSMKPRASGSDSRLHSEAVRMSGTFLGPGASWLVGCRFEPGPMGSWSFVEVKA
mmetsp:Transcript_134760/g.375599  ORF Transcript_134760/g.375599 Transcript_134760/m.375599 type:complete len:204 (-) Transcript_134760:1374-1985(-)